MLRTMRLRKFAKQTQRVLTRTWLTRSRIVADLRALGVANGELLLVHPALPPLGYVFGGPRTVVVALSDVVGAEGTVVLPSHTWQWMDEGCREFDVRTTPACVGAIAEEFRKWPGVARSLHPTHSVAAMGPLARQLVEGHDRCRYPCGPGSPYSRALELGCRILLLGTGLESNTSHHTVEALADVPYLLKDDPEQFVLIDESGTRREAILFRHRPGVSRSLEPIERLLSGQSFVRRGRVGSAPSLLIDGPAFRDLLLKALRADPTLLLADPDPWLIAGQGSMSERQETVPCTGAAGVGQH